MPQQKIREIEGARFRLRERAEYRAGREELIAMRARNALDALFTEHLVEHPSGSAVGIRDENRAVRRTRRVDERADGIGDFFGTIVQLSRQASDLEPVP